MAGSISLSLQQMFDTQGNLLSGGRVYFIQAGTVAAPQNAYQDAGLTLPWANYYTLLADGRIPLLYFADGYIKVRITDQNGVQVFNQDNIPVTGFSSGGGGGGGVDPTTVLQTGWVQPIYGTGIVSGFVRLNARTIGSATSGATERANSDTAALFAFLWNADPNLTVSSGRGASAAADFSANKTIALPNFRGRVPAGLGDMGNADEGLLTAAYFGASGTTLGASGGVQASTLLTANLPPYTPAGTLGSITSTSSTVHFGGNSDNFGSIAGSGTFNSISRGAIASTGTFTGTAAPGQISTPVRTVQPTILITFYIKL